MALPSSLNPHPSPIPPPSGPGPDPFPPNPTQPAVEALHQSVVQGINIAEEQRAIADKLANLVQMIRDTLQRPEFTAEQNNTKALAIINSIQFQKE